MANRPKNNIKLRELNRIYRAIIKKYFSILHPNKIQKQKNRIKDKWVFLNGTVHQYFKHVFAFYTNRIK